MSLKVSNLSVKIEKKQILSNVSLEVKPGEVVALMGPNGSGKSTLANTLMGNPQYTIISGKISIDGKDITNSKVEDRAKQGLFLSFQYPQEIQGLSVSSFLRGIYQSKTGRKVTPIEWNKTLKTKMDLLNTPKTFLERNVNEGFSGGEKKQLEMLQMAILEPKYALLDETDSGLDVDALKTIAHAVEKQSKDTGVLVITHYTRILKYLKPDRVIVMKNGRVEKEGGPELAHELEEKGYQQNETKIQLE